MFLYTYNEILHENRFQKLFGGTVNLACLVFFLFGFSYFFKKISFIWSRFSMPISLYDFTLTLQMQAVTNGGRKQILWFLNHYLNQLGKVLDWQSANPLLNGTEAWGKPQTADQFSSCLHVKGLNKQFNCTSLLSPIRNEHKAWTQTLRCWQNEQRTEKFKFMKEIIENHFAMKSFTVRKLCLDLLWTSLMLIMFQKLKLFHLVN